MHPGASQNEQYPEMTDLLISSSLDWTVKLWAPRVEGTDGPLLATFESSQEFVYDCQWSPTHPAVFAACDAEGYVDVWDVNRDRESPLVRCLVREKDAYPLNCLRWTQDGRRLATGDSSGKISLLAVESDLSTGTSEDFDRISALAGKGYRSK